MSTCGKSLLVVDDEPDFAAFVGHVACERGYRVTIVTNPHDFKAAYGSGKPDVIVIDIIMPEIDGLELVKWLADRQCAAKLIVVSGYIDLYVRLAEALGVASGLRVERSLTKPISYSDLCAAIPPAGAA